MNQFRDPGAAESAQPERQFERDPRRVDRCEPPRPRPKQQRIGAKVGMDALAVLAEIFKHTIKRMPGRDPMALPETDHLLGHHRLQFIEEAQCFVLGRENHRRLRA